MTRAWLIEYCPGLRVLPVYWVCPGTWSPIATDAARFPTRAAAEGVRVFAETDDYRWRKLRIAEHGFEDAAEPSDGRPSPPGAVAAAIAQAMSVLRWCWNWLRRVKCGEIDYLYDGDRLMCTRAAGHPDEHVDEDAMINWGGEQR